MPRILGIDFGERRIGLALSDPEGRTAFPYSVLDTRKGDALKAIAGIVSDEGVDEIVLGWPLRSDTGAPSKKTIAVEAFAQELARRAPVPIHYEDESFSSYAAESALRERGWKPSAQSKGEVDRQAARVILQDFLDRRAADPS